MVLIDISDIQDEVLYRKYEPELECPRRLRASSNPLRALQELAPSWPTPWATRAGAPPSAGATASRYNAEVYPPWLDYFWLDNKDTEPYADPLFPLHSIRLDQLTSCSRASGPNLGVAYAREHMQRIVDLSSRGRTASS